MNEFWLEEWERLPFHRVLAPSVRIGPFDWRGVMAPGDVQFVHMGWRGVWAFFRPLGTFVNYVVCYQDERGGVYPRRFVAFDVQHLMGEIKSSVQTIFLSRPFCVGNDLCLWSSRRCGWLVADELVSFPISFAWEDNIPSCEVFGWLRSQCDQETSEARFALQWGQLTTCERLDYVSRFLPQISELRYLMAWVLQCLPFDFGSSCIWRLQNRNGCYFAFRLEEKAQLTPTFDAQHQPSFLVAWNTFLFDYFLSLLQLVEDLPLCVRDWFCLEQFVACAIHPSSHERLEARLQLHDWVKQNAPERADLLEEHSV